MCSRNVLSSKTRWVYAHLVSSCTTAAVESRARLRAFELIVLDSVAESSPERRETEPIDGEGRASARCLFLGEVCLLVAGGRF